MYITHRGDMKFGKWLNLQQVCLFFLIRKTFKLKAKKVQEEGDKMSTEYTKYQPTHYKHEI